MIKREDVIIDSQDPRVEGLIGKKVLMGNSFKILKQTETDINHSTFKGITKGSDYFADNNGYYHSMIAPIPEPIYEELQDKWVKENGVKVGDKVKVLRHVSYGENGWNVSWMDSMDRVIGNVGIVKSIDGKFGVLLLVKGIDSAFFYPYFALEIVPGPTYRPFESADEYKDDCESWIVLQGTHRFHKVIAFDDRGIYLEPKVLISYGIAFADYLFGHGKPFGVKE